MQMKNIYFPDEEITENDLYFICYMIERTARKLRQRNKYVVNAIGENEFYRLLSIANVQHCENPLKIEDEWINEYGLKCGDFDITNVNKELCDNIPSPTDIGDVYRRLIAATMLPNEEYPHGIIRVYNDPICETIDNYNSSAYYEPSYYIARAYNDGQF